jgi:spore germination cell wall hydrolase CwlJ-like protein
MFKRLLAIVCFLLIPVVAHAAPSWGKQVIAAVLVMEADVDGEQGLHAVMNVIQNRASASSEAAYLKVIRKPKQFSCKNNRSEASLVRAASKHATWEAAQRLVEQACASNLQDITDGATHYHENRINPFWTKGMTLTITIGSHKFYKEN